MQVFAVGRVIAVVLWAGWAAAEPPPAPFDWPRPIEWTPAFRGVDRCDVVLTRPRPLRVHALRVELDREGVSLCTDLSNGDRPEEIDGLRTSTFLAQAGCQAAINTTPYWPVDVTEGTPLNAAGLVVSRGELISPVDADTPRAALVVRLDGSASIEEPPLDLSGVETAVGGYGVVLQKSNVVRPDGELDAFIDTRHPRTGVGLGPEGRTLFLVVVDGRQAGYSEGASLAELGEILRKLGATEGLNLDGGGGSTMVLATPEGAPLLLNRPVDGGVPGRERVTACHLGVRAEALP